MRLTERKACVRCGLSAKYQFLDLDENGVCFCRNWIFRRMKKLE